MTKLVRFLASGLLGLAFVAPAAHAGLFDDAEARQAILDLRRQISESNELRAKENAESAKQIEQLRRSLLDLNTQLELMRVDMAKLRGTDEQLARDISDVQRQQKDLTQGVDARMSKLEPQKVVVDGQEITADPEEKRAYEEALGLFRSGDYAGSAAAFSAFQKRYSRSGYAPSVQFWLGSALYGKRDYREAMTMFRTLIGNSPDHPNVPEAMLSVANCQIELRDAKGAKRTLDELGKKYPQSEAAKAGRERIASLR
jgi:tol-pal system protein YbgF